jgi:hypothetical protein
MGAIMNTFESGYPMMAEHEVEYIKAFITNNNVKTVLEWGSGNSTIWFPKECPNVTRWLAIEHNGHYVKKIEDKVKKEVVEIKWIQDTEQGYIDGADGEKFDLIIVDGMFRDKCLEKAFSLLADHPTARILLHDSGRVEYEAWYQKYKYTKIYGGEIPQPKGGFAHRGIVLFGKQ